MKNRLLLIATMSIIVYTNCNERKNQLQADIETETIDFFNFKTIESDDGIPDFLIKEKKYILLDNSNDDFLFKSIDKIKVKDNKIYILDQQLRKLLVFMIDGKGLGKVGKMGQGPQEYLQIDDFDIHNSGDIYLIDGRLDKLFVFDKNFQFISVKKMPFEADIIQCLSNDNLMFGLSSWNKGVEENTKIVVANTALEIERSYMQYDEYRDDSYWISGYTFVNVGDNIQYNKPIDNFVYQFSTAGIPVKAYWFDFGKKNVPDEDKKDIEGNMEKYKTYCCLKNFTVVTDNYILGTLRDQLKTKTFIIDRKNKQLYLNRETTVSDNSEIAGYYDNCIISYIYPGKYDDIQAMDFPADVKKHIEDENFVLCLYTLK
jgi:hypothetical protein